METLQNRMRPICKKENQTIHFQVILIALDVLFGRDSFEDFMLGSDQYPNFI
jgi:hypothetical protein